MNLEFKKILNLINEKKFKEAIIELDILIKQEPNNFNYYYIRGFSNLNLQHSRLAISDFSSVIKLKQNHYLSYHFRGISYLNLANYTLAISDFNKLINFKPDSPEVYNNLGWTYYNIGENEKAIENFLEAIKLKKNYKQATISLINILSRTNKISNKESDIISIHNSLNKILFEYTSNKYIKDEQVKVFFNKINHLVNFSFEKIEFDETQIYRTHAGTLNCERHKKVFNTHNVIPEFCFGCYKVQIEPTNVLDLIKLYLIFDNLSLKNNNIRKCMIELRPKISGHYKGLIYCKSLKEAELVKKDLDILVKKNLKKELKSIIKRGCTEYGIKFPQYQNLKQNLMFYDKKWKKFENLIDEKFPDLAFDKKYRSTIKGVSLSDVLIFRNWLSYAKIIGDETHKYISNENFESSFIKNCLNKR